MAIAIISTLIVVQLGRHIALPHYPHFTKLVDIYGLGDDNVTWNLVSRANSDIFDPEHRPILRNSQRNWPKRDTEVESKRNLFFIIFGVEIQELCIRACTYPTHEILNTHISSSFTIGILTGLITSNIVGLFPNMEVVSDISLAISVSVAAVVSMSIQWFGLYGRTENKMHKAL